MFENYTRNHVDRWFNWAQKNASGVERMEDLILVSGCTMVTSWAAAVSLDNHFEATISLVSRTLRNVGARFVWGNISGAVEYHNSRFDPVRSPNLCFARHGLILLLLLHGKQNPPTTGNQCVFIRGFRARRVLFGIRVIQIGSGTTDGNPRRTHRRNLGLRFGLRFGLRNESSSDSHIRGSSLDTNVPIKHEKPQLRRYPSSITLHSNGSVYNASIMTSLSYDSHIEVLNELSLSEVVELAFREMSSRLSLSKPLAKSDDKVRPTNSSSTPRKFLTSSSREGVLVCLPRRDR
jgi:hypothetical protein